MLANPVRQTPREGKERSGSTRTRAGKKIARRSGVAALLKLRQLLSVLASPLFAANGRQLILLVSLPLFFFCGSGGGRAGGQTAGISPRAKSELVYSQTLRKGAAEMHITIY